MKQLVMVGLFSFISMSAMWGACFDPYVNLGVRAGYEVGLGFAPLFNPIKEDSVSIMPAGLIHNSFVNAQIDIRLLEWFSLAPEVNVSIIKRAVDESSKIQAKWNEISFSALALFHVGFFYAGIGPGVSVNTKPRYTTTSDVLNSKVGETGDSLKNLGLETKMSVRFIMVSEIGFLIPLGYDALNFQVGLRATVAPSVVDKIKSPTVTECEAESKINGFAGKGTSFGSTGFFLGMTYSFE